MAPPGRVQDRHEFADSTHLKNTVLSPLRRFQNTSRLLVQNEMEDQKRNSL